MATLAFRPLSPGVLLMRRLRIPVKLVLMALTLLLPMAVLVTSTFITAQDDMVMVRQELVGARQISRLVDLAVTVQHHRDLALRSFGEDPNNKQQRAEVQQRLKQDAAALDSELLTPDRRTWDAVRKSIGDIVEGRTPVRRDDLHAFHAQVVEQLRQQLMLTAEASGLLLDPEATSYHLMDLAVERVVPWLEVLSQARGQGSAVLTRGEPKQLDRMAMLSSAEQMSAQLQNLQMRMDALSRAGHAAPQEWDAARQATEQLAARTRTAFSAEILSEDPEAYFGLATRAVDASSQIGRAHV